MLIRIKTFYKRKYKADTSKQARAAILATIRTITTRFALFQRNY